MRARWLRARVASDFVSNQDPRPAFVHDDHRRLQGFSGLVAPTLRHEERVKLVDASQSIQLVEQVAAMVGGERKDCRQGDNRPEVHVLIV